MIYEKVIKYNCKKTTFGKIVKKGFIHFVYSDCEFIEGKNDVLLFIAKEWSYIEVQSPNKVCYVLTDKVEKEEFIK